MFDDAFPLQDDPKGPSAELPLRDRVSHLQAHINAAQAELTEMVGELEDKDLWAEPGVISPAHWVAWRCGMSQHRARRFVELARGLSDLPKTSESFRRGEISFDQAECLAEAATPNTEEELLTLARTSTASHLKKIVAGYKTALRSMHSAQLRSARYLSTSYGADGSFRLSGRFTPEEGAIIRKALRKAEEELQNEVSTDDPPDPDGSIRQADAFVAIADSSLAGELKERSSAERFAVTVFVDSEALTEDGGETCELEDGPLIHPETARRISCDSSLVGLLRGADGTILDSGRKTRKISAPLRRALHARDRCCQWEGCERTRYTEAHHIKHWIRDLGETELTNLVRLCWTHHDLVHAANMSCEPKEGGGFIFHLPDGSLANEFTREMVAFGATLRQRYQLEGIDITPETSTSKWMGEKLHLADAVYDLFFQPKKMKQFADDLAGRGRQKGSNQGDCAEPFGSGTVDVRPVEDQAKEDPPDSG